MRLSIALAALSCCACSPAHDPEPAFHKTFDEDNMTVRKTANPLPAWLTLAVPIVSVVISICATFLSYKTYTSNKLLYRPYAIATPHFDDTGKKHGIYLSNAGLGPAIIKNMTVTVDGKEYSGLETSIWPRFTADMGLSQAGCFRTGWPLTGAVVKSGEEVPLFTVSDFGAFDCMHQILQLLANKRIVLDITYFSLYGDEFSSSNRLNLNDVNATRLAQRLAH
jgi:hypothetical protein